MRIIPEQARFVAMVFDESDTWDLSDQDRVALQWAMGQIESLQGELDALRKLCPQAAVTSEQEAAAFTETRWSLRAYHS